MSSSCRAGRREKLGGRERGKEGGRGKRYENMTCLRIGRTKTIHSSGFPSLPWSLLHLLHLGPTISSYHVKGSPSLPRLIGCLILREQFTSRAQRQWPACLPPPRSIPLYDRVQHGNAPPSGRICFEVLLDALEATDTPLKLDHIPAWEKIDDRHHTPSLTLTYLP